MKTQQIVKVDHAKFGIDETKANEIAAAFLPTVDKMKEFLPEFERLDGLEMTDEKCRDAKLLRLKFVKVRTNTAAIHKDEKAGYLSAGKYCDAWKNAQLEASTKYETRLKEWEEHYQRIEKQRVIALQEERAAGLLENTDMPATNGLGLMTDEVWNNLYAGAKAAKQARLTAEAKAEQDRIDAEEKARVERIEAERKRVAENERVEAENAKLKKEVEEAEAKRKAEKEKVEAQQAAKIAEINAKVKREQEEVNAKFRAEQKEAVERAAKLDREQTALSAKRDAEQKVVADKLLAEQKERQRVEAQLKIKSDAEKELKREEEEAKQAELHKGDADRLDDLVKDLKDLQGKYGFDSDVYQKLNSKISRYLDRVIAEIAEVQAALESKAA